MGFKKVLDWFKTSEGILAATIVFLPLGIFLIWRYGTMSSKIKNILIAVASIFFLSNVVSYALDKQTEARLEKTVAELESTKKKYNDLDTNFTDLTAQHEEEHTEYLAYKEKMKPYEALSEADAKKKKADSEAAQKVTEKINDLPSVEDLEVKDKKDVTNTRKLYDALTKDQKNLVDVTKLKELENELPILEKKAAEKAAKEKAEAEKKKAEEKKAAEEAAAAKKKAEEEEARGYETGITYDQLARTPDDYMFKKVKFSGKVLQVMEDDDTTQIRLAVDENYDTVLLAEYSSDAVKSRILEDDYITIYGSSYGLITYESTMGGKITIPSVSVDKVDQ